MDEKLERLLREGAVRRYDSGERVTAIAVGMNRSREWVHAWIRRCREACGVAGWSASGPAAARRSLAYGSLTPRGGDHTPAHEGVYPHNRPPGNRQPCAEPSTRRQESA